jgi:hypothetical protein
MAYISGTVTSIADLRAAIAAALVANGYTALGNSFSKNGVHVTLVANATYGRINVLGGLGVDAAGALTSTPPMIDSKDASAALAGIGPTILQFPASYFIHINTSPDEVWVFVRESVDRYSWLGFGCSPAPGSTTGNWFAANTPGYADGQRGSQTIYATGSTYASVCALPFDASAFNSGVGYTFSAHHGLDGNTWSACGNRGGNNPGAGYQSVVADAYTAAMAILYYTPSKLNNEAILVPIRPQVCRGSNLYSTIADIQHCRYIRIDNLEPEDVITLGADKWKVYPVLKKNAAVRDAGGGVTHSGTYGVAVRYDGP